MDKNQEFNFQTSGYIKFKFFAAKSCKDDLKIRTVPFFAKKNAEK